MQFDEMGNRSGKALMLRPGTVCDYQMDFATVLDRLGEKYPWYIHNTGLDTCKEVMVQ